MADVAILSVLLTARDRASGVLRKVGQNATQLGLSLVKLGAPLTAVAALSLKTFAQFEKSMVRVQAVSKATASEFAELEAQAKLMGRTTIFTATESAEALAFMAQAGLTARESIGGLPAVLELAAAGGIDLAASADLVTNVMAGMGLEVHELSRANDVLVTAFTSANTNLLQLGQAFKFAGPVAAAAGLSLEEVAATLALMGNAGIQATMAGTALRGAITRLLNPSKEAGAILRRLGITAVDSTGELRSFRDIIVELEASGLSTADAMTLFGLRAGPGMLALLSQGSDALIKLTEEMENAGGTSKRIAEAQMDTFVGSMATLKAVVEDAAISLGEVLAPTVRDLAGLLEPVIDSIARWVERNPAWAKGLTASSVALVAIGSALAVLGLILPGIITLVTTFGIALGISTGGLTLATGLIAAFAVAYAGNLFKVRDATNKVFDVFNSRWGWLIAVVLGPAGLVIKGLLELGKNWREVFDTITQSIEDVLNWMLPLLQGIDDLDNAIRKFIGLVPSRFEPIPPFDFGTDFVQDRLRGIRDGLKEIGDEGAATADMAEILGERLEAAIAKLSKAKLSEAAAGLEGLQARFDALTGGGDIGPSMTARLDKNRIQKVKQDNFNLALRRIDRAGAVDIKALEANLQKASATAARMSALAASAVDSIRFSLSESAIAGAEAIVLEADKAELMRMAAAETLAAGQAILEQRAKDTATALENNARIREAEFDSMTARLDNENRIQKVKQDNFNLALRRIEEEKNAELAALNARLRAVNGGPIPGIPGHDVRAETAAAGGGRGGRPQGPLDEAFARQRRSGTAGFDERGDPIPNRGPFESPFNIWDPGTPKVQVNMDGKSVSEELGSRVKVAG